MWPTSVVKGPSLGIGIYSLPPPLPSFVMSVKSLNMLTSISSCVKWEG